MNAGTTLNSVFEYDVRKIKIASEQIQNNLVLDINMNMIMNTTVFSSSRAVQNVSNKK